MSELLSEVIMSVGNNVWSYFAIMKSTVIDCYGIMCCDMCSNISLEFWQQNNRYFDDNSFVHCLFVGVFVAMKMMYGSLQEIRTEFPMDFKKFTCVCHKMRLSVVKRPSGRVIVSLSTSTLMSLHQQCQIVNTHTLY